MSELMVMGGQSGASDLVGPVASPRGRGGSSERAGEGHLQGEAGELRDADRKTGKQGAEETESGKGQSSGKLRDKETERGQRGAGREDGWDT